MKKNRKTVHGVFVIDEDNGTCTLTEIGERPIRGLIVGKPYKICPHNVEFDHGIYFFYEEGKTELVRIPSDIGEMRANLLNKEYNLTDYDFSDVKDYVCGEDYLCSDLRDENGRDNVELIKLFADRERFAEELFWLYKANRELVHYSFLHPNERAVQVEEGREKQRIKRDEAHARVISLAVKLGVFGEEVLEATGQASSEQATNGQSLTPKPQQERAKPTRGKGRPKETLKDKMIDDANGEKLQKLHSKMVGKKGKDFALLMLAGIKKGWLTRPTYTQVKNEFGDIGSKTGYNKYLNENMFTKEEIEGAKTALINPK